MDRYNPGHINGSSIGREGGRKLHKQTAGDEEPIELWVVYMPCNIPLRSAELQSVCYSP